MGVVLDTNGPIWRNSRRFALTELRNCEIFVKFVKLSDAAKDIILLEVDSTVGTEINLTNSTNALFGFGGSKTTTTPAPKPSLGAEIRIPLADEDVSTGEVVIPFNNPSTTTTKKTTPSPKTNIPVLTVGGIGLERKTTVDVRAFTTTTINPKFTAATRRLPSSDRDPSSGCPNRIDAYTFGPENQDYAFYEHTVFTIKNNRITDRTSLEHEFPGGPSLVNGALYDPDREILWLISERSVYGFKKDDDNGWKLQSVFPKTLPSSISFTPDAAIRWHNKHQVLLSNGGKFALYDEYWNKSLLSGRTENYFENLPDRVRGISAWDNVSAHVFTQSLVFEYDAEKKKVIGDGVALGDFWRSVDPCKRQPFHGRCPSQNGETPKRSQFVLRYYLRNGECVSYPYGHCASDPSEPTLYRYKEECEDACISNVPANLGVPKSTTEDYQKEILAKEVKRVEFYATSTYEAPSSTTSPTTSTSTEDPQPFEFHEELGQEQTTVTQTQKSEDKVNTEMPFNFNEHEVEHERTTTTTTTTTTATTRTSVVPTTTTSQVPTTTTEEPTTASEDPITTTTEEPTTATERMSTTTTTTTTTTSAPTTTTTTRRQTTTTEAPTTTTSEVPTTPTPRTECERRRASAATSSIRGSFVPVCTSSGDFERVQCETDGRQCFCVDGHGIEVPNSRTRDGSRPDCYSIQTSRQATTKECVGVSAAGPCHGTFQRYFYNEDSQKCEHFTYSGCGGNGNNYESREACEERCAPPPVGLPKCEIGEPLKTKIGVPVNCAKTDCPSGYRCSVVQHSSVCCPENNKALGLQTNGRASRCALPKERGPCDKYELRFYFNADLNECKYFFWGGCEGNLNNFERVEECESACGVQRTGEPPRVTNKPNTEIRTTQGIRITPNAGRLNWQEQEEEEEEAVQTTTPLAPTTRVAQTHRAPVPTTTRPAPTTTTRAARVQTTTTEAPESSEEEVEEVVDEDGEEPKEQPLHVQPPVSQQNSVLLGVNRCLHPRDSGNCRGQFVRWFFDAEKKNCDVFTYTGCQGNGNNFASREECLAICHKPEPTPSATPDFTQVCSNDVDAGECNGVFERFAFDSETADCRAFTYGGCGGNGNNFATLQECRSRCVQSSAVKPTSSCDAEIDVGECAGVFARFAFDKSINSCRAFTYGGCGGNANNFATLQECTNKCVNRGVCPETPACDLPRCQLVNDRSGCPFCSCPPVKTANPPGTLAPPNCTPLDRSTCREPCMMFHNRQGCEECVCPQTAPVPPSPTRQPSGSVGRGQPPASSSSSSSTTSGIRVIEVGPPAPRTTEAAPPAPRQFAVNTLREQQPRPTEGLPRTLAAQIEEKCMQPVEPGPCKNFADRWYFNVDDGTCHPFKYGGCAGNRNHFFTQKECEVHCARFLSGQHDVSSSSTAPLAPHVNSPTSSSSSEAPEVVEEEIVAFPAPKLHHRQFSAPTHAVQSPIGYGSDKIDSYSPPTPNNNLVGLSPPVHPTYFTYNGQDQGQRRLFSASQRNFENRVESPVVPPQQLKPFNEAVGKPLEPLPVPFIQRRFDGRQRFETPSTTSGDVVTSPSAPASSSVTPPRQFASTTTTSRGVAPELPQSRFHPRTHTSEPVELGPITPESFARVQTHREVNAVTPESSGRRTPRPMSSFQPTHSSATTESSKFPHRFVATTTTTNTPWYQTTSTPWWLRSPSPSPTQSAPILQKKRPELKIEKLDKAQGPPRFNFDPARYTFYNGDYYGPTIPGIRVNQTGLSEAEKKEAQEAFEQFKELSKGFQEQANKFLEQERAQGRTPQRGSFIIGSVRTGSDGIHDDSEELAEDVPPRRQGLRAHGVPIQPTVPLVVPTYAAPTAAVRGPNGKIEEEEGLEHIGAHEEPHPPAPSTTIVPRLPSARIQGFQVTRPTTTTATTTRRTTTTTQATTTTTESSAAPEVFQEVEETREPVIKEVQEEKAAGNAQIVDLEKFNVVQPPRAQEPPQDFDREMLGSGEGSGSEFEEASEEKDEEVNEQEPELKAEVLVSTTTGEVPTTTTTQEPTTTTTTEVPVTTTVEEEVTTTTPLKKIQIRPRVHSTTTTAPTTTTTTEEITTKTTSSFPHSQQHPEMITSSESGEIVSDFAFNSDEEHDENTEIVETTEPVRAAASKTLEAAKAVETLKPHKEVEEEPEKEQHVENGISRKMESINMFEVPEIPTTTTQAPTQAPTTATTIVETVGTTPQPHFEPKFDGRIVCALPPDAGVCANYTPRWFFNSQTGQCEQFAYGSCGGNENNFFDRSTCERKCMPHHVILAQVPERCSFEKDAGSGKGYNVKWYFNMKNLRCEQFVFEGLGGNTNQFETLSECERICTPAGPKTPTLPPVAESKQDEEEQEPEEPEPEQPEQPEPEQPLPELPTLQELPRVAPVAPIAPALATTTATTSPFNAESSDEEYEDADPIILPEPGLPPQPASFGLVDENVELRLPEVAQTVRPTTTVASVVVPLVPVVSVAPDHQPSSPVAPQTTGATTQAPTQAPIGPIVPIAPQVHQIPLLSLEPEAPTVQDATPLPPAVEPRPPAAHAAKTVITTEEVALEKKGTYKAEPVLGREHIPTANDGQPLVGASPKETVNYQTGEVKTPKASGIRNFDGSQDSKISVDVFNKAGPTTSINGMPACANGRTEVRYSDGRPVMCLPGKNQCPDGSACFFNGIDFFCCPEEEDPYDKHAFGGYGGDEAKNGYKVFGALNIRRLMDEVPLRQKRQSQSNVNFNIDSVVAPLRFDAEKPRTVSRALRMKTAPAVPRHGANPLCIQPVVKGSCEEAHLRYYYDRVTDSCRLFEYSGCDGNANNFGSLEDCQRLCVLNVKSIKNGQIATSTLAPVAAEEDEKLQPGQCPGGRAPLGGSSPVLCGNSTESIGCPTSYYCRRGPPDVCCPGTDPKLMQPEEIVKEAGRGVVKNESHMPRGFNRQIFLSTPKYMCPDAADPLMLENGEPMLCGSGFDGVKMCPKGYYCAIDAARNSRLCCPLYGDAQRIASEEIFAPRLASNTESTTTALFEVIEVADSDEDETDEEDEDFVAHLRMKPQQPMGIVEKLAQTSSDAEQKEDGGVSIDLGGVEESELEEATTAKAMSVQDKSVCQIKPSEGHVCNENETATRTNLQYFYSPRDNRCKLFFFRGCGGNLNRFEKKSDCEALCL
ncbi:unnamed protein product [Caenorhabditis sp. 36 PRJEB53466]|nr:unnamed protein product [Caenorhabditis sp. 36 PRJEB53466]